MNNDAFLPVCGILCLWPLLFGVIGFWIGRGTGRGYRIRSPFGPADGIGYGTSGTLPKAMNQPVARSAAPGPVKSVEK